MPLSPVQAIDPALSLILKLGSGIFWTITYILIIKKGREDKTYGMPMLALCANISWEFIYSFIFPHSRPQLYIDYIWFFLDCFILFQFLKYGKKYFPDNLNQNLFYPGFILCLILTFTGILVIGYEFQDFRGIYAAFSQNLLMSVLFVFMLLRRNSADGQSLGIAVSKMIGTLLPSFLFYLYFPGSYLLTYLYIAILLFDMVYLIMIYQYSGKQPAENIVRNEPESMNI